MYLTVYWVQMNVTNGLRQIVILARYNRLMAPHLNP